MAFEVEQIRATAQRVAASHGLDVVELEFHGGAKHRILRIFIEKNAEERKRLAQEVASASDVGADPEADVAGVDQLAGVTHTDCETFSRDFGTMLDVEDLIPGSAYTLEVSSPGLDRKLHSPDDYERFAGMLVKLQTFEPVEGNRHWQGRLGEVNEGILKLAPEGKKSGGKKSSARKAESPASIEIALKNIEKAQLVPEF